MRTDSTSPGIPPSWATLRARTRFSGICMDLREEAQRWIDQVVFIDAEIERLDHERDMLMRRLVDALGYCTKGETARGDRVIYERTPRGYWYCDIIPSRRRRTSEE